ncbi:MAG: hypothetical protein PHI66_04875 [Candidatus Pacebacteria bacterium]|nr:hypothetical protein [Candidatus Paceibacterota bacterium]
MKENSRKIESQNKTDENRTNNAMELLGFCLRSKRFKTIIILIFVLIFLIMFQSWMFVAGYSDSTAALAIIYGAIISFVLSMLIVFMATMSLIRKTEKRIVTVVSFLAMLAAVIFLWIVASSNIIAALIRNYY